jgi:hypothetical protein
MIDLLQQGQQWLAQQLNNHASRSVVYRRGELGVELTAVIGRSSYQQDDGHGLLTRSQVRDFLIDTDALLLSIIGSLPRPGDRIVEIDRQQTYVFEVVPLGAEPHWRYSDVFRTKLRIHTKQIEIRS